MPRLVLPFLLSVATLVACVEPPAAPPLARSPGIVAATADDAVSAYGTLAGHFVNPFWTGDVQLTVAASGAIAQWDGARGTVTWRVSPSIAGFPFDRLTADVRCMTGEHSTQPWGQLRRLILTVTPRTRLPAPYDGQEVVGIEIWERNGALEFSVLPQFEFGSAPGCSWGGGFSIGHVPVERGGFRFTVPTM